MTTSFIFKTMDMPVFPLSVCLFFRICSPGWFETCYIIQAALQVLLLLSLPVRFWDHKWAPPHLVLVDLLCIQSCHLQTVFNILSSFLARTAGTALNRIGRLDTVVLFLRLEGNLSVFPPLTMYPGPSSCVVLIPLGDIAFILVTFPVAVRKCQGGSRLRESYFCPVWAMMAYTPSPVYRLGSQTEEPCHLL